MITVVSGLPRSGTSMMMQMLVAAGLPILSDNVRKADVDNPRGYLEWEPISHIAYNPEIIAEAEGKAVKVVSNLLQHLPPTHDYKIIFMRRTLAEVIRSQDLMYEHRHGIPQITHASVERAFEVHLREIENWCGRQPNIDLFFMHFHGVLQAPKLAAKMVTSFLFADRMAAAVDSTLWRNRSDQSNSG